MTTHTQSEDSRLREILAVPDWPCLSETWTWLEDLKDLLTHIVEQHPDEEPVQEWAARIAGEAAKRRENGTTKM